jgi:acid phosphatase
MKKPLAALLLPLALLLFSLSCNTSSFKAVMSGERLVWPVGLPVYDHVVIVVEENKDYEQIIGSTAAPYLNELAAAGASFTRMFAEEHHSQGNYFWLFSGSNQGVGFNDRVPRNPIAAANLGTALPDAGRTFAAFSEDLPAVGSTVHRAGLYARKHAPWVSFANVPAASNLRWKDFPARYEDLPTVSFVIPNLVNDMHDGRIPRSIAAGDAWLRRNLDGYRRWAEQNNSLLIITFDEDDNGPSGLTDPRSPDVRRRNRIATIFFGARVKPGAYEEGKGITHVNILRTLESMYGLERMGGQQPNALAAGIADDFLITDVFGLLP